MHSPDLKVSNEDMKKHHKTLLQLAEKLVPHVPEMKDLEKEITQVDGKLLLFLLLVIAIMIMLLFNIIVGPIIYNLIQYLTKSVLIS